MRLSTPWPHICPQTEKTGPSASIDLPQKPAAPVAVLAPLRLEARYGAAGGCLGGCGSLRFAKTPVNFGGNLSLHIISDVGVDVQRGGR